MSSPSSMPSPRPSPTGAGSRERVAEAEGNADLHESPSSSNGPTGPTLRSGLARSQSTGSSPSLLPSNSLTLPSGPDALVRRHHTLSTSSSRLVRTERNKARVALQVVGLSEDDQRFYLPESPVQTTGWSSYPSDPAPRLGRTDSATSSVGAAWGGSPSPSLPGTPVRLEAFERLPLTSGGTPSSGARSSFVVVRASKGDAPLSERQVLVTPPRASALESNESPRPPLGESRNSLKPFLENEGEGFVEEEDWERSIVDERMSEQIKLDQAALEYASRPSPPPSSKIVERRASSPFGVPVSMLSHSRSQNTSSSSPHTRGSSITSDPWGSDLPHAGEGAVRRRQSLQLRNDSSGEISQGTDRWGAGAEEFSAGGMTHPTSSFSRARGTGLGPPGLSLSISSLATSRLPSASSPLSLTHPNSLASHPHHPLAALLTGGGPISPSGVYPRSPWSPTVEEAKELGMGSGNGTVPSSLTRGGSGSSRGSGSSGQVRVPGTGDDDEGISPTGSNEASSFAGAVGAGGPVTPPLVGNERRRTLSSANPPSAPSSAAASRRLPPLMTNSDILASLATPTTAPIGAPDPVQAFLARQGPASAAAYVPPIGHSHLPPQTPASYVAASTQGSKEYMTTIEEPKARHSTAVPGVGSTDWTRQKEALIGTPPLSTANAAPFVPASFSPGFPSAVAPAAGGGEHWPASGGFGVGLAIRQQEQIVVLQNQMAVAMQAMDILKSGAPLPVSGAGTEGSNSATTSEGSPIDIPALILAKGYNPPSFELRPPGARFFVIKSYTEEDVHKSLKHEIWASTDLGNKRLDRAFRESGEKGPIYLFFSVNASGHFAGMAQMLTPVDCATSSTVWASDKWKGVLKVRWIYIKDVPLASLRHIRLSNTPENKPVTSSRDTQEVPYDAGCEVLRILSSFQSRTSLLQDFAWYETRTMQGATAPTTTHYQQAQLAQQAFHQQQQAQYHPMQQQHFLPPPLPSSTPPGYQQQHQQQFPMMQGGMMDNGTQQGGRRFYTPPPLPNGPPPPRGNYGGYPGQGY